MACVETADLLRDLREICLTAVHEAYSLLHLDLSDNGIEGLACLVADHAAQICRGVTKILCCSTQACLVVVDVQIAEYADDQVVLRVAAFAGDDGDSFIFPDKLQQKLPDQ